MMIFTAVFVLLFLQEGRASPPHRMPQAKFTNISREAFKRLNSESWAVSELATERKYSRGGILQLTRNRKHFRNPTELDLNSTKLKEFLADAFEPQFMSETEPGRAWHDSKNELGRRSEFEAFKHGEGKKDSISKLLDRERIHLNEVEFEDIRFWIWNLTRCTVEPSWKNFGARIWPRYVNVGKCSTKTTCSLPSGMKCQPSEEKSVRLLHWICRKSLRRCFWSSFETKIIRACKCLC